MHMLLGHSIDNGQSDQGGSSKPEKLANCVKEAHATIDAQAAGSHKSRIPQGFKDLMKTPVSVLGYATKDEKAGVKSKTSLLATILRSSSENDPQGIRQKALEYERQPSELGDMSSWDPDVVSSEDEKDEGISEGEEGSAADTEFPYVDGAREMANRKADDAKLEEEDRLEDAIYEQELWDLMNGPASAQRSADSTGEREEDDALLESDNDGDNDGVSEAEKESLADLSDSEEDSELDIRPGSSDEEAEPLSRASTSDTGQAEGRKRMRTSATSYKRIGSDEHDGRFSGRKHKTKYRTQEFISTSDEEEE